MGIVTIHCGTLCPAMNAATRVRDWRPDPPTPTRRALPEIESESESEERV